MDLNPNPKVSDNLHIEKYKHDDLVFALNPDKPGWAFINSDGLEILNLCNGNNSIEDITTKLSEKHSEANKEQLNAIVVDFISQMQKNMLLINGSEESEPNKYNTFQGTAIEITNQCNLNCTHCYLGAGKKHEKELSFQQIINILDSVKELGGTSVSIGGGEPLMRNDCLEILNHANAIGLLITFGTNGTTITKEIAKELSKLPVKIQISFDGATPETHDSIRGKGSFQKAMAGMDYLIAEGKADDIVIAFTVMKSNLSEIPGIIDLALSRKIHFVQFPPLTSSGRAKENWDAIKLSNEEKLSYWKYLNKRAPELKSKLDLLADCFTLNVNNTGKPFRCNIGSQMRVDPTGNVFPCQCFHYGESFNLGNINNIGFKEIVLGEKIKNVMRMCFDRPTKIAECKSCRWINFCGAGCMGNAFEEHSTVYKPESCKTRKKWIEKLFEVKLEDILSVPQQQEVE